MQSAPPPGSYASHYPPQPQHAPQAPRSGGGGSWVLVLLVVLGAGVFLVGILATLAIYGVRRYIGNAKQAEARNMLAAIGRDAVAAYEGGDEEDKQAVPSSPKLCASASQSVPTSVSYVSGVKYMSTPAEWSVDAPTHAGFACLGFSMSTPQYYVYDYRATSTTFTAKATGDLDGDGVTSSFELRGALRGPDLVLAPALVETSPEE